MVGPIFKRILGVNEAKLYILVYNIIHTTVAGAPVRAGRTVSILPLREDFLERGDIHRAFYFGEWHLLHSEPDDHSRTAERSVVSIHKEKVSRLSLPDGLLGFGA